MLPAGVHMRMRRGRRQPVSHFILWLGHRQMIAIRSLFYGNVTDGLSIINNTKQFCCSVPPSPAQPRTLDIDTSQKAGGGWWQAAGKFWYYRSVSSCNCDVSTSITSAANDYQPQPAHDNVLILLMAKTSNKNITDQVARWPPGQGSAWYWWQTNGVLCCGPLGCPAPAPRGLVTR